MPSPLILLAACKTSNPHLFTGRVITLARWEDRKGGQEGDRGRGFSLGERLALGTRMSAVGWGVGCPTTSFVTCLRSFASSRIPACPAWSAQFGWGFPRLHTCPVFKDMDSRQRPALFIHWDKHHRLNLRPGGLLRSNIYSHLLQSDVVTIRSSVVAESAQSIPECGVAKHSRSVVHREIGLNSS